MKKENAEKIGILSLQLGGWLNGRLIDALEDCPEDEVKAIKLKFGRIMADLLTEIMNPIYSEHPELKPVELGGIYKVDPTIYFDKEDGTFRIPK
jgi:hypothetical protein